MSSNGATLGGTGQVTSDSLAAESLRNNPSRGFASNEPERGPAPSSNTSGSTTANTTDTSGAIELAPTPDRYSRLSEAELQGKTYRTPAEEPGLSKTADSTYSTGQPGNPPPQNTGDAPTAYAAGSRATGDQLKAKGKNIQEVDNFGEAENAPNASFDGGQDIGGKNDPARKAEQAFANSASLPGGDSGYPTAGKQGPDVNQGGYEQLNTEESA